MSSHAKNSAIIPALSLGVACVLSYALLTPWLGYAYDDWLGVWIAHSLGGEGLRAYTTGNRPAMGWLFTATTSVLGEAPLPWHVLALVLRWLGGLAIWWTVRGLWPDRRTEALSVALLFSVYPGFNMQPAAWIIGQGSFVSLLLYNLSLAAMIHAQRSGKARWTIVALLTLALSMLITEYFVGLEVIRPLILWIALGAAFKNWRSDVSRLIRSWLPYGVWTGAYLVWRVVAFRHSDVPDVYNPSSYLSKFGENPIVELLARVRLCLLDLLHIGITAWLRTITTALRPDSLAVTLASLAVAGATAVVILWLLRRSRTRDTAAPSGRWAWQAVLLGAVIVVAGMLPYWFADRHVDLDTVRSRFTQSAMLGVALATVGAVWLVFRTNPMRLIVIAAIVGLSAGFHFRNANRFRWEWEIQKSLAWQMHWRMPGLTPGSALIINTPPITHPFDYLLAPFINYLYAPDHRTTEVPYWCFNVSQFEREQLDGDLANWTADRPAIRELGPLTFTARVDRAVVAFFAPPRCLRVLRPGESIPGLPESLQTIQHHSNPTHIKSVSSPATRPPEIVFGAEPDPCWCMYFQQADLAAQDGRWTDAAAIADTALAEGVGPEDATEWLPLVDAYVHTEDESKARDLISRVTAASTGHRARLAALLDRAEQTGVSATFIDALRADIE